MPFKLSTLESEVIPSDILPVILHKAANKRLPTGWPFKSLDVLNLYSNKLWNNGSVSDKDAITFLKSPTAGISNSSLNLPVLFPLSATVITAVISRGKSLSPASK